MNRGWYDNKNRGQQFLIIESRRSDGFSANLSKLLSFHLPLFLMNNNNLIINGQRCYKRTEKTCSIDLITYIDFIFFFFVQHKYSSFKYIFKLVLKSWKSIHNHQWEGTHLRNLWLCRWQWFQTPAGMRCRWVILPNRPQSWSPLLSLTCTIKLQSSQFTRTKSRFTT